MTSRYFQNENGMDMAWLYSHIMNQEPEQVKQTSEDIHRISQEACQLFPDAPEADQEYLQFLSVIASLSCDVYLKKQLIEKLVDSISFPENEAEPKEVKKKR